MTSSLKRKSLSKPVTGALVPAYDLALVRGRNKNKAHSFLLQCFEESGVSKAELAQMLSKRPEQITRWLGGPGNLTLDTLSDLLFALKGEFLEVRCVDALTQGKTNRGLIEWWKEKKYDGTWTVLSVEGRRSEPLQSTSSERKKSIEIVTSTARGQKYEQIAAR